MVKIRSWVKAVFYLLTALLIYSEVLAFVILPLWWPSSPSCAPPSCYSMLLVADPQILSSQNTVLGWLLSFIARWDSDRYLKKTFTQALGYIRPDIIVFLGDIMDEGHISSDAEFSDDLLRFHKIFLLPELHDMARVILVPGDNDIGGDNDVMIPHSVHRFDREFDQSEGAVLLEGLQIYKVNSLTYTMQEPYNMDSEVVRVAISHIPILPRASPFVKAVVKKIQPDIIFSGHDHVSTHVISTSENIWRRSYRSLGPNETGTRIYRLHSGLIHELVVPTCSYRMGVSNMGYGAAFIDTREKMLMYHILWLPARFLHLFNYALVLLLLLLLLACLFCSWMSFKSRRILHIICPL